MYRTNMLLSPVRVFFGITFVLDDNLIVRVLVCRRKPIVLG